MRKTSESSPAQLDINADARARYFRLLGDPTRLRALEVLLDGERTVGELVEILGVPRSRVSNHLACLKWCGFATSQRRGRQVFYRASDERVRKILELSRTLSAGHRDHLAACRTVGPDWI